MRLDEVRGDEIEWRRLRRHWDTMRNFQEKLRCDEAR